MDVIKEEENKFWHRDALRAIEAEELLEKEKQLKASKIQLK